MAKVINGVNIPNMPWQDAPKSNFKPIWRYTNNPVIDRDPNPVCSRVFNSALVPYNGEFIGVFRGDKNDIMPNLFVGRSKDGIHFTIDEKMIEFEDEQGNKLPNTDWQYDPRVIPLEDKYYIVYCDEFGGGPTIAIAYTKDFKKFVKLDNPFLPCNRNGVLFPRKINGKYYMLSRPSDAGHTAFGNIYLSTSTDMLNWGGHKLVATSGWEWWCSLKIGAGPVPIETDEGWLVFIHGVTKTCNDFVYSIGALILDIDDPSKVLYRCQNYLLTPIDDCETRGFVPNVTFPTATLVDAKTGRIAIYYGASDTYTCLAFTTVNEVIDYIKKHSR